MAKIHGIITGDIVSSGEIVPEEREKLFKETTKLLKKLSPGYLEKFETYRGDSLQCKIKHPAEVLRVAMIIRSFFRSYTPMHSRIETEKNSKGYFSTNFDIRLSIGIGEVDFIQKKITSSDGQAFRLSGEALDNLKETSQRLSITTINKSFDEQMEPAILLVDSVIQKWTQNQAELVYYKLMKLKEDEIASTIGISQSAVTQRKKTAQWYAIEKLLTWFEKTVSTWK